MKKFIRIAVAAQKVILILCVLLSSINKGNAQGSTAWILGGNTISSKTSDWLGTVASAVGGPSSDDMLIKSLGLDVFEPSANNLSIVIGGFGLSGLNGTLGSFIIGANNSIASGENACFLMGDHITVSNANGNASGSYAFGYGISSGDPKQFFALGRNIDYSGTGGFVIGTGYDASNKLQGSTEVNSLSIGFNSTEPTLYISPATGFGLTGNVGIATGYNTPSFKLDVNGTFRVSNNAYFDAMVGIGTQNPTYTLEVAGNLKAGESLLSNTIVKTFYGGGVYNPSAPPDPAPFQIINDDGATVQYHFYVRPNNGNIGLGSNDPQQKLHVEGAGYFSSRILVGTNSYLTGNVGLQIKNKNLLITDNTNAVNFKVDKDGYLWCRKVYVTANTVAADYVFEDSYSLLPLPQLKTFIIKYKHLPNIPSAQDIKDAGNQIDVENFQMKLLEKVEELTLYILKQQEEIETLKAQLLKK